MTTSRQIFVMRCIVMTLAGVLSQGISAQGIVRQHQLTSALANEAVGVAVTICAKSGYAVTAVIVNADGVRQSIL